MATTAVHSCRLIQHVFTGKYVVEKVIYMHTVYELCCRLLYALQFSQVYIS